MTPKRYTRIVNVLNHRQPDLTIISDEVHKGRNIAAIMRTCDAVGIDKMHIVEPKAGYRHYRGTALGSHKWVDIELYNTVDEPIQHLKARGFQILIAHLSEQALDYRDVDYTQPTALLFGKENHGPSPEALSSADAEIAIPMVGMVGSYNVSVASAIILAEAYRQRELAGFYNQRRLSDEAYEHRLFRWCHPDIAKYCDQRGLDYPPLNDEGELQDAPGWYHEARLSPKVEEKSK